MARKTAMSKEPGKVSIAIPRSEKERLGKDRGRFLGPTKGRGMDDRGQFQLGEGMAERLGKDAKPGPLTRQSPGVYRNSAGQLVGSKGQALPGQKQQSPTEQALNAANQAAAGMARGIQRNPAPRPGQEMPQQDVNAAMEAGQLANSIMDQYNVPGMDRQSVPYPAQIQSGLLQAPQGQQFQMPMQNLMYQFPQGQTPPDMRLFAPANPQGMNMMQGLQPQVAAQPNTVSGLLRRGR